MSDDIKMCGPWTLSAEVLLVNDDTGRQANVTISLGLGEAPNLDRLWERATDAREWFIEQVGPGWRLAGKRELFDAAMRDRTGTDMQFAMPGSDHWDEPAAPTPEDSDV